MKKLQDLVESLNGKKQFSSLGILFDELFAKILNEKAIQGEPGPQGEPGYTPEKGVDYFDGEPGPPGKDGEDGYTPVKDKDYFDGKPGKPGKDGSPDTPEQIAEKVNTLEEKIKPEVLIGWKKLWEEFNLGVDKRFKEVSNSIPRKGFLDQRWHGGGQTKQVIVLKDQATVTLKVEATNVLAELLTLSQPSTIANPTGSFYDGQQITYRIKSISAQPVTWGSMFRGSVDLSLPTTTSGTSLTDYAGYQYNAADDTFDLLAKNFGF